jgi:hypothetical protein
MMDSESEVLPPSYLRLRLLPTQAAPPAYGFTQSRFMPMRCTETPHQSPRPRSPSPPAMPAR